MKITAIIPTLNEEINIEQAIKSVDFADEIIVIDSYSSDNTVSLAKKHNVNLIMREFDDYSSQKNYAIEKAKHNWIYVLDADERVTPKLKKEITEAVKTPNDLVGFNVFRTFYFAGKKLKYSGYQHDKVIRLFRKDKCQYNGKKVHERIKADGEVGFLNNKLEHYTYRNYNHFIEKLNRYAGIKAQILYEKGASVNAFHLLIKPPVRFIIHYFIKGGIFDGFPGFMVSIIMAYGVLTRYIKLWLLNHNRE